MPASSTFTMCGVSMFAAARASRSKRPISVGFFASSAVTSFTATRIPVTVSVASWTEPIPPAPISRWIRYRCPTTSSLTASS